MAVTVLCGPPPAAPLSDPRVLFQPLPKILGVAKVSSDALIAIGHEHSLRSDSRVPFKGACGGLTITTTCEVEWLLVRDPARALKVLQLEDWLMGGERTPPSLGFRVVRGCESSHWNARLAEVNERLRLVGDESGFDLTHLVTCRMFTGPCGLKYHRAVSRAHNPGAHPEDVCCGNAYPTTIYHLAVGVGKLSQLTRSCPLYGAPSWSPLPPTFFVAASSRAPPTPQARQASQAPHASGAAATMVGYATQVGACLEMTDEKEAVKCLAISHGTGLLFEIHQTSVQRAADLEWLAQVPAALNAENVYAYSPLTTFDVARTRYEGAFTILELHPTTRMLAAPAR